MQLMIKDIALKATSTLVKQKSHKLFSNNTFAYFCTNICQVASPTCRPLQRQKDH